MDIKLFDSELKVMDVLWHEGQTRTNKLFGAFVGRKNLPTEEIQKLKQIVGDLK